MRTCGRLQIFTSVLFEAFYKWNKIEIVGDFAAPVRNDFKDHTVRLGGVFAAGCCPTGLTDFLALMEIPPWEAERLGALPSAIAHVVVACSARGGRVVVRVVRVRRPRKA